MLSLAVCLLRSLRACLSHLVPAHAGIRGVRAMLPGPGFPRARERGGVLRYLLPVLLLCGCASPLPPPAYEAPPPTPMADLRAVEWLGPKPVLDDLDTYVENFRKLAFWTEWNGRHPYVKKWRGLSFCVPDRLRGETEGALRKLRVATGTALPIVATGCSVNISLRPNVRGCLFGESFVHVGLGVGPDVCLEEELSQRMGLLNDISYRWTIWNDDNNGDVDFLTWHDAIMLRVLYQQELHQGMSEEAAMKIVPRLMRKVIGEVQ